MEFRHNADRIVVWEDLRPEDAGRPVANVEGPAAVAAELDLPEDLGPPVVAVVAPEPEPADVQSLLAPGGGGDRGRMARLAAGRLTGPVDT